MKYISGVHALNIENSLNTCGDWHASALNWNTIKLRESNESIFGDWGIEPNKRIPEHTELYNVADDLRAILDILVDGNTRYLRGFRNDFLCTDEYNDIFFDKVYMLKSLEHWDNIDELMRKEFMFEWLNYIKSKEGNI